MAHDAYELAQAQTSRGSKVSQVLSSELPVMAFFYSSAEMACHKTNVPKGAVGRGAQSTR